MTRSTATQLGRNAGRRGPVATITIGLIVSAAVLGLIVSAVTFLALAIAFQIAVPIAQHYAVTLSAADMAAAGQIAGFWWVFGALSVASFLAAGVAAMKAVRYLDPLPRA